MSFASMFFGLNTNYAFKKSRPCLVPCKKGKGTGLIPGIGLSTHNEVIAKEWRDWKFRGFMFIFRKNTVFQISVTSEEIWIILMDKNILGCARRL